MQGARCITLQRSAPMSARRHLAASPRASAVGLPTIARPRQQQRASQLLQRLGSYNASQFSSFQGAKLLLPECWVPTGAGGGMQPQMAAPLPIGECHMLTPCMHAHTSF